MWHRDILEERNAGLVRCAFAHIWCEPDLAEVLLKFGLFPKPEALSEVSAEKASRILAAILRKDLAYKIEAMSRQRAKDLADAFVLSQEPDARFFVNGEWDQYLERSVPFFWNALTNATFDAGVIAVGKRVASCVWVEDED